MHGRRNGFFVLGTTNAKPLTYASDCSTEADTREGCSFKLKIAVQEGETPLHKICSSIGTEHSTAMLSADEGATTKPNQWAGR
jgi:hypothetical protein